MAGDQSIQLKPVRVPWTRTFQRSSLLRPAVGEVWLGRRCWQRLSRLPWTISIFRGTATAAGGASVGVAYPVVDPDRPGENDFLAAEATVTDTQFDRLLQLLSVAVSAPEIHLAISGLTYGSGLENATRVWTLPDTLPISTARMTADVSGRPYLANVPA